MLAAARSRLSATLVGGRGPLPSGDRASPFSSPTTPLTAARYCLLAALQRTMATSTFKYVILGGGNAAGYAARAFAADGGAAPGSVCMVSREEVLPYERPALSKAFLFADPPARLPGFHTSVGGGGDRQDAAWYESKGITVKLGADVTAVDVAAKKLTTASGDTVVATDALILATGCEAIKLARTPGADLKGIHTLREYADGLELYDGLKACAGKKVVVVGGGYIGMEVAAAANLMGCDVTMLFPEASVMPRLFTPEIAAHYEEAYKAKGVKLLNDGRLCEAFLDDGSGAVKGVMFCKEHVKAEIEGQLVVVGVGARPNVALVKDQGLKTAEGGLVVDGSMATSAPGVYAVGDIAAFPLL
uniref:MDAR n=1 Tax=Pyropia haitanensis TaxID=1262161 RepID=A0A0A7TUT8_PYRHA|nr:MDAR [Neoporphyra haitanensis]